MAQARDFRCCEQGSAARIELIAIEGFREPVQDTGKLRVREHRVRRTGYTQNVIPAGGGSHVAPQRVCQRRYFSWNTFSLRAVAAHTVEHVVLLRARLR